MLAKCLANVPTVCEQQLAATSSEAAMSLPLPLPEPYYTPEHEDLECPATAAAIAKAGASSLATVRFGHAEDITVLTSKGVGMCKSYTLDLDGSLKVESYGKASNFSVKSHRVNGIADMAELLVKLSQRHFSVLIRGKPKGALPFTVKRNLDTFSEPEHGCLWVMLDFDGIKLPDGLSPISVEGVEWLVSKLPPQFHKASYFYQFSASAGIVDPLTKQPRKPGISVHVFFWFDRPVPGPLMASFLAIHCIDTGFYEKAFDRGGSPRIVLGIDDSVIKNAVQPHYVALPQIGPGVECHLAPGDRQGLIDKQWPAVVLPDLEPRLFGDAQGMLQRLRGEWQVANGRVKATSLTIRPGAGAAVTTYYKDPSNDPTKLGRTFVRGELVTKQRSDAESRTFVRLYFEGESSPGSWYVAQAKPTTARRYGDYQEESLKPFSEGAYTYVRDELKWFDDVPLHDMTLTEDGYLPDLNTFITAGVALLLAPTGSGKTAAFIRHVRPLVARGQIFIYAAQTIALTKQMRDDLAAQEVPWVHYSDLPPGSEMRAGVYVTTNKSLHKILAKAKNWGVNFHLVIDEWHAALDDFMKGEQKARELGEAISMARRTLLMTGTITELQKKQTLEVVRKAKPGRTSEIFGVYRFAPVHKRPLLWANLSGLGAAFVALLRSYRDLKKQGKPLPRVVIIAPMSAMKQFELLLQEHELADLSLVISREESSPDEIEAARVSDLPILITSPLFSTGLNFEHPPVRLWAYFGNLPVDTSQVIQTVNRANRGGVPCEVRLFVGRPDSSAPPPLHPEGIRSDIEAVLLDESEVPGEIDPHFMLDRMTYNSSRDKIDKNTGRALFALCENDGIQNYTIVKDWVDDLSPTAEDKETFERAKAQAKEGYRRDVEVAADNHVGLPTSLLLSGWERQAERKGAFWDQTMIPKVASDQEKAIAATLTGNANHFKRHQGPNVGVLRKLFADTPPWLSGQYTSKVGGEQPKVAAQKTLAMLDVIDLLERLSEGKIDGVEFALKLRLKKPRQGFMAMSLGERDMLARDKLLKQLDDLYGKLEGASAKQRGELKQQMFKAVLPKFKDMGVAFKKTKRSDGHQCLDPAKPEVPPWDWVELRLRLELLAASLTNRTTVAADKVATGLRWPGGPIAKSLCDRCAHCDIDGLCSLGGSATLHDDEPTEQQCHLFALLPARVQSIKKCWEESQKK
jgi:hypothetical protein